MDAHILTNLSWEQYAVVAALFGMCLLVPMALILLPVGSAPRLQGAHSHEISFNDIIAAVPKIVVGVLKFVAGMCMVFIKILGALLELAWMILPVVLRIAGYMLLIFLIFDCFINDD